MTFVWTISRKMYLHLNYDPLVTQTVNFVIMRITLTASLAAQIINFVVMQICIADS